MHDGELLQDGPGCAETRRLALWFASRMDSAWLVQRAAAAALEQGWRVAPGKDTAAAPAAAAATSGTDFHEAT